MLFCTNFGQITVATCNAGLENHFCFECQIIFSQKIGPKQLKV